jgi:hypothetical protein
MLRVELCYCFFLTAVSLKIQLRHMLTILCHPPTCCVPAAIAALGIDPVINTGAPDEATSNVNLRGAAAGAAAAGVKRESGVKRERGLDDDDDNYVPRSATAADRIDLTEEVSEERMALQ